ncbi:hypothetical protein AB0I77_24940 [Streptomyces sp. NPDC050619]|uniref:hypothetical protein n=1 Tax=Streptomyces sp. NPDC050619 TaxID=3157214 RepID=UPI003441CF25
MRAVRGAVVGVVLCTAAALPGSSAWAAGTPSPYAFPAGARTAPGATSTADAQRLAPGTTYRSSLPSDGTLYYRLELDATSSAYVSVTAVPHPGTTVSASDGIRVSVQDANSRPCSVDTVSIGASRSPHPITALGEREPTPGRSLCQNSGTYYVLVERVHREGSSTDAWDLELAPVAEPRPEQTGPTSAPETWNSTSPEPLTDDAVRRRGGGGFGAATPLQQGVWRDDVRPGQTLFYEVPVDWGQQLNATAELGSSSGGKGFVSGALTLSLYNPVRGFVDDRGVFYNGSQKSADLEPLPPVAYANRHAVSDRVSRMRFAGSYYLVVHLAEQVTEEFGDGPFGLTLRVRVSGAAEAGPGYAGESAPPGLFEVAGKGREAVSEARTAANGDTGMRLLAASGLGTGTVLLVGLGVWTALGRRRARA